MKTKGKKSHDHGWIPVLKSSSRFRRTVRLKSKQRWWTRLVVMCFSSSTSSRATDLHVIKRYIIFNIQQTLNTASEVPQSPDQVSPSGAAGVSTPGSSHFVDVTPFSYQRKQSFGTRRWVSAAAAVDDDTGDGPGEFFDGFQIYERDTYLHRIGLEAHYYPRDFLHTQPEVCMCLLVVLIVCNATTWIAFSFFETSY